MAEEFGTFIDGKKKVSGFNDEDIQVKDIADVIGIVLPTF